MKSAKKQPRRDFLKCLTLAGAAAAAGATGFPAIVRASALGRGGAVAPSDRIVMAGIGFGMQGPGNMRSFLEKDEVQWVAVCDLDEEHLAYAKKIVDDHYGRTTCAAYKDFRELFRRKDLDAVMIAVPDHWHAILYISAMKAGLDVYGEKPLSHSLREGRLISDVAKRYGRVWQTGSWQRSVENFHRAAELVRNGRLGRIKRIEVGLPSGHHDFAGTFGQEALVPPPPTLDYGFWVGPAPWWPYCKARVHMNWRWNMDFGGGQLMDWIGHHADIAHWGMGWDETGPVEVEATGVFPRGKTIYNSPTSYYATAVYAGGTPMIIAGGHDEIWMGTKWIGEYGWIYVNRGEFMTEPASLQSEIIGPEETRLYRSRDHSQNFLDCVRSRRSTITPAETAHRSASVGHLSVIAMETGRKIRWNPGTETIIDDTEAERLLNRTYRAPWQLPE